MSHDPHDGTYRVFADSCNECLQRASGGLEGLAQLDRQNLRELAAVAADKHAAGPSLMRPSQIGASYADMRGVETLRLAARIVMRSGIAAVAA